MKSVQGWRAQLDVEAKAQLGDFNATVAKAKADAAPLIQAELAGIADWGKARKRDLDTAAEAQQRVITNASAPFLNGCLGAHERSFEGKGRRGAKDTGPSK